ncbi:LpqB family beta-propeller domain-containing protein [Cellulomonas edaphi]|uniref:LpqB family beta-propeller domain-containing protein n=1 Tax=Cellulomonas edaphi TaxID=3053468 RepID=A0ABT7S7X9_9CELL|nr:LpqB family beta-propeller domain-containing protein [Cellulomons edaphi]MDM7831725.1 LpqB family beta-propeller domain-containing protein [Cellulomons edaphi]
MTRRLRCWAAAVAAMAAVALTGCTAMPTEGPVVRSDVVVSDPGDAENVPEGPHAGAGPSDLVESFLLAGATGFGDDFVTAREYFSGEAREAWKPLAGVVVAGPFTTAQTSKTQVTLDVPVLARIDGEGRYTEAPPDARESVTYDLVRNADGEWRIASAPDGLVISSVVFETQFRSASVYFLAADEKNLVPETRWFPVEHLPTHVMKALIAGPSPWLRDAVRTAVPDGTQLKPDAVEIDAAGTALVRLAPMASVLAADRGPMLAQIYASLLPLSGVGSVQVKTGEVILEDPDDLESGTQPDGTLEFLQAGQLVGLDGRTTTPVAGVASLDGLGLRHPARNEDGSLRVAVANGSAVVTLPEADKPSVTLVSGQRLVAPSVDRFGWVWTASSGGGLVVGHVGGEQVAVKADFLDGREVRSVRVARDGTRVAVISAGTDGVTLNVGAVTRDAKGAPQQIGEVIQAGATLTDATAVVWADESTLAVLGRSAGTLTVHRVPVSGPTVRLPEVADVDGLAGGRLLYVSTTEGALRREGPASWAEVPGVTDVLDPSYPG